MKTIFLYSCVELYICHKLEVVFFIAKPLLSCWLLVDALMDQAITPHDVTVQ